MPTTDPLAFTSIVLNIVLFRILADKGFISSGEIRERVDQAMLLWEESQFVKADAGRVVHANLEMILSVIEKSRHGD